MNLELVSRAEFDEWAQRIEACMKALQLSQGRELIVYDNERLSQKLGVSKRTLQNWRDDGLIKFSQVGHKIYYTEKAVIEFLETYKIR